MGVIYEGQPEVGEMEGAPAPFGDFRIEPEDHAYGPVNGTLALRTAIDEHVNPLFLVGKRSR